MTRLLLLPLWLLLVGYSEQRTVPARLDICNRVPNWKLCPQQGSEISGENIPARPAPPLPPTGPPPAGDKGAYCQQYEPHYTFYCTGTGNDNPQAVQFCQAYSVSCNVAKTPAAPSNPLANAGPEDVARLCQQYQQQAQTYCTGNEQGQVRQLCDAYRQYCRGGLTQQQPSAPTAPSPVPPPQNSEERIQYCGSYQSYYQYYCSSNPQLAAQNSQASQFCQSYHDFCSNLPANSLAAYANANNSAQARYVCTQYSTMADAYCPGYESVELRQYCNMYRVYCRGQKPFPIIDGNVGVNTKNWGVAGIPFYPFNPQGAIAGGERLDVGFGDWGAAVTNRKGVTDFYDQQDKFLANWQQGQYGGGNSWNVPIVGVGGYTRTGVSLGGLANLADYPSLLSGGVPLPGPGLAGISGLAGQPNPLAFGNGLNSPTGFGGPAGVGGLSGIGSGFGQGLNPALGAGFLG